MASEEDETFEAEVEDWEIEEGLPQMEDQFIQRYFQGRNALIEQEKKQRSGLSNHSTTHTNGLITYTRLCLPPVTIANGTLGLCYRVSHPG